MKLARIVLGLVIALAIVLVLTKMQFMKGPTGGSSPQQVIDVEGVKTDLVTMGQAERYYLAIHGSYASLEQLQQDESMTISIHHRGYNYTAEVDDGQHFKITAAPSDPAKQGWPTLSIDESMQVTQQ